MHLRMAVLILGIFCVGTAELSPSGMLGELSRDLSVTIPTAGLLVTVYALTVVIGGPIVTAITTCVRRKYLLILLLLSAAGNIACRRADLRTAAGRSNDHHRHPRHFHGRVRRDRGQHCGWRKEGLSRGRHLARREPGDSARGSLRNAPRAADRLAGHVRKHRRARPARLGADPDRDPRRRQRHGTDLAQTRAASLREVASHWHGIRHGSVLGWHVRSDHLHGTAAHPHRGHPAAWIPGVLLAHGVGSIVGNFIGGRCANRSVDATVVWLSWTLAAVCVLYWFAAPSPVGTTLLLVLFSIATFALIPGLQIRILTFAANAPALSLTVNMAVFALGAAFGSWAGG